LNPRDVSELPVSFCLAKKLSFIGLRLDDLPDFDHTDGHEAQCNKSTIAEVSLYILCVAENWEIYQPAPSLLDWQMNGVC